MLDSVIFSRDKWLKPGGSLYPSHARMYLAAVQREAEERNKYHEYVNSMEDWNRFVPKTISKYGVDMSCLTVDFDKEHADYYLGSSVWCELKPNDLLTEHVNILSIDCNKCTIEDIKELDFDFNLKITSSRGPKKGGPPPHIKNRDGNRNNRIIDSGKFTGFAGWFEVDFKGSSENPAVSVVTLSTGPHIGYTHWGQQCFFLHPPVDPLDGDSLEGNIKIRRRKDNQRLINVEISHKIMKKKYPCFYFWRSTN